MPPDPSTCALHDMGMHFIILDLSPPTSENVPMPLIHDITEIEKTTSKTRDIQIACRMSYEISAT